MKPIAFSTRPQLVGFSLVEILIALLVLSVGLLGFAALQVSSINNNQEAYLQSQALAIANDLASRMRANREYLNWDVRAPLRDDTTNANADQNVYSDSPYNSGNVNTSTDLDTVCGAIPESYSGVSTVAATVTAGQLCIGTGVSCTAKQLAAFDRWQICRSAIQLLPDGEVRVACRNTTAYTGNTLPTLPAMAAGTVDFLNPYYGFKGRLRGHEFPHPVFNSLAEPPNLRVLNGTAVADSCRPGSLYTIAVYWTPSVAKSGLGERGVAGGGRDTAINSRCNDDGLVPGAADLNNEATTPIRKTCVLVDINP